MVKITKVDNDTLASKAGIRENDILVSINGHEIEDVLDYQFYLAEKKINILIKRDEMISFEIQKGLYEDIGLEFETPLMDKKRSCQNKCIFCFIDQLPGGLRDTLYFKDDDSRLSFLHGNYVTLTNLTKKDIDRIIDMHISPINVSVHTTNPELRCKMMHNKRAGEVLDYLNMFKEAGIDICGQIVLCKGINDGEELEKTLYDLAKLYPSIRSVSIVPAGLTSYRQNLYKLEPYDKESSRVVIEQVERINAHFAKKYDKNLFFCSDEFYLMAEMNIPSDSYYEDYSQIENGVGMLRSFETELDSFLKTLSKEEREIKRNISIATGVASYKFIVRMMYKIKNRCKNITFRVYEIVNDFFGHTITVSGLVTGKDLYNQLKDKDLGDELLISRSMLRAEGDLFLCGMSIDELREKLKIKITPTECDGTSFALGVLGLEG